jgi:hypothetical protein
MPAMGTQLTILISDFRLCSAVVLRYFWSGDDDESHRVWMVDILERHLEPF